MRTFPVLVVSMMISESTWAVVSCPPSSNFIDEMRRPALKALGVNLVGEAERKSAADFGASQKPKMTAREVERRYAATGTLTCLGPNETVVRQGQAQVTLASNVITTAGHINMPLGDCSEKVSPPKCYFDVMVDGKDLTYLIKSEVATGYECPPSGKPQLNQDWAVYTLAKPVDKRVKPYRIPKEVRLNLPEGTPVVAVGKSRDWPPGQNFKEFDDRPRHYGTCKVGSASEYASSGLVQTDCDGDHGMSGGSIVTAGPDPTLVAIHFGSYNGPTEPGVKNCDAKVGATGHDEFRKDCWAETAAPISGALATAIMKAAAGDTWTAPEPGKSVLPKIKL